MHFYGLDTAFHFGQHKGLTVRQVLEINPSYLGFCVRTLDHFALRRADVITWQQDFPALQKWLNTEVWAKLDAKEAALKRSAAIEDYDDRLDTDYAYQGRNSDRGVFDALTDGQYGDFENWGGNMDSLRDALGY